MPTNTLYRCIVRSTNPITGICGVEVPAALGTGGVVSISPVGLTQTVPGVYDVPALGEQVVIMADQNDRFFWLTADPAAISAAILISAQSFATTAANAASAAAVAYTIAHPTGRNMLDNSTFEVDQLNTSGLGGSNVRSVSMAPVTTSWLADRWNIVNAISGITGTGYNYDVSVPISAYPGPRTLIAGFATNAKPVLAASDYLSMITNVSGRRCQRLHKGRADAQPFTYSFWCTSSITGTFIAEASWYTAVEPVTRACSCPFSVVSVGLQYVTVTFPADTGGNPVPDDDENALSIAIFLASGSTYNSGNIANLNTTWTTNVTAANRFAGCTNIMSTSPGNCQFNLANPQAEVGLVATPLEIKTFAQELRECQRSFIRLYADAGNRPFGMGQCANTTQAFINIELPTPMRHNPTVTTSAASTFQLWNAGTTVLTCTGAPALWSYGPSNANGAGVKNVVLQPVAGGGGLVAGNATVLLSSAAGAFIDFDAR